jgi:hypothetical protein
MMHRCVSLMVALGVMIAALGLPPDSAGAASPTRQPLQQAHWSARVVKPFGAAVRSAPSGDASVLFVAACNERFPLLDIRQGWYQVSGGGWIGGGRLVAGADPPFADCGGGFTFQIGQPVGTSVATGCLSLRTEPSREAAILHCVANGHRYEVVNGPLDPGTGEDWFVVRSPSTGRGWVLAEHLYPL